jgi:hypothetical protein
MATRPTAALPALQRLTYVKSLTDTSKKLVNKILFQTYRISAGLLGFHSKHCRSCINPTTVAVFARWMAVQPQSTGCATEISRFQARIACAQNDKRRAGRGRAFEILTK